MTHSAKHFLNLMRSQLHRRCGIQVSMFVSYQSGISCHTSIKHNAHKKEYEYNVIQNTPETAADQRQ